MAASIPHFTFNNGEKFPSVGLGCWMGEPGKTEQTEEMVKTALKHGYRHFDTAAGYGNEEAVGKAIRGSVIPRSEIFVTTKLGAYFHGDVRTAFEDSLNKLGLKYIDLYLMHWPMAAENGKVLPADVSPTFVETWKQMEQIIEGKVKSIGVSNFSIKNLEVLLKEAIVVPVTNQVELHPAYPSFGLLEYCKSKNILLTAYSPLGQYNTPFFSNTTLQEVAKKEDCSVSQILISWAVQRGTIVIPKSEKEERIRDNIKLVTLSDSSMSVLNHLHELPDQHRPLCGYFKLEPGKVFGWTYEQLGWDLKWDNEKNGVYVA
ncbi:Aldo/keto reductase [Hysterangium stoloniferum]|nr:Aldo/keto reductase [Hysterangium stoloniferum]